MATKTPMRNEHQPPSGAGLQARAARHRTALRYVTEASAPTPTTQASDAERRRERTRSPDTPLQTNHLVAHHYVEYTAGVSHESEYGCWKVYRAAFPP